MAPSTDGSLSFFFLILFHIQNPPLPFQKDNDPTNSEVISTAPWEHVDLNLLQTIAAEQFHGSIEQTPPLFSAIRSDGKRLYDRARKDGATLDDVTIKPRIVHVHHVGINSVGADAIVDEQLDLPYFGLHCEVGSGT